MPETGFTLVPTVLRGNGYVRGARGCWMSAGTGRAICIPTEDRGNERKSY